MKSRLGVSLLIGLLIGTATSYGQEDLGVHWQALANAASPWLLGAFVAGALLPRRNWGIAAGLLACAGEVAGYYVVTPLRGFSVGEPEIVFWSVCAVVGGPLFGWAGWAWRHAEARWQTIGAAALPATFIAEAMGTYALRLHYRGDAALFAAIGLLLAVLVAVPLPKWWRMLPAIVGISLAGVIAYGWVLNAASQAAFGA